MSELCGMIYHKMWMPIHIPFSLNPPPPLHLRTTFANMSQLHTYKIKNYLHLQVSWGVHVDYRWRPRCAAWDPHGKGFSHSGAGVPGPPHPRPLAVYSHPYGTPSPHRPAKSEKHKHSEYVITELPYKSRIIFYKFVCFSINNLWI